MSSVGARELKQNPQSVIRRVLETGEELEITSYGRPTGVRLVPDSPAPRSWVSGRDLADIPPLGDEDAERWKKDLRRLDDDGPSDPWERE